MEHDTTLFCGYGDNLPLMQQYEARFIYPYVQKHIFNVN